MIINGRIMNSLCWAFETLYKVLIFGHHVKALLGDFFRSQPSHVFDNESRSCSGAGETKSL